MPLAPIVIFAYNRPEHTRQTIEYLSRNPEAAESILYIYCDGAKEGAKTETVTAIEQTQQVAREATGFAQVEVRASKHNKGLANSVMGGISEVLELHDRVIVVEDDVLCSVHFLKFMNEALERFKDAENVTLTSGYMFPVPNIPKEHSSFFMGTAATQAWGTWRRAWKEIDFECKGYERVKTDAALRKKFDLDGVFDTSGMLIAEMETDKVSSWAVRIAWNVINKGHLTLYPDKSLMKNIGWDGSGMHSGTENPYEDPNWDEQYYVNSFPEKAELHNGYFTAYKTYLRKIFKPTFAERVVRKLKSFVS